MQTERYLVDSYYAPESRRRPDPYYHPSPLKTSVTDRNYSGYGPETYPIVARPRQNGRIVSDEIDEGIHSQDGEQAIVTDDRNSKLITMNDQPSKTTLSDNHITSSTKPLNPASIPEGTKSSSRSKSGVSNGPSPQRTFYVFEKVREGIMKYVEHLRVRIGELSERFERSFGATTGRSSQYGSTRFGPTGDGIGPDTGPTTYLPNTNPVSLEKRIKNAERLLKHLEYHCTKVDKLFDDYLQNHKLREGAKNMSFAYCDPAIASSTKAMKESLTNLDVERKTCELTMCGIETKLRDLMGTYHFCIKEIAGFARIGSGDQFVITIKYGTLKKFKARCKVNRKLEQHWDKRGAVYPCLIPDVMELKAKELKTFGKNAQLIRTALDPIDMLSIVPILKFVKLNQNGSLKLNMLFFWNPLGNEPVEELEYLYGQQFIDAFLSSPTPSEFQLPFLPVLDNVTSFHTLPARVPGPQLIGQQKHGVIQPKTYNGAPPLRGDRDHVIKRNARKTLSPNLFRPEEDDGGRVRRDKELDRPLSTAVPERREPLMGGGSEEERWFSSDMEGGQPSASSQRRPQPPTGLQTSYKREEQIRGHDAFNGVPRESRNVPRIYREAGTDYSRQNGGTATIGSYPRGRGDAQPYAIGGQGYGEPDMGGWESRGSGNTWTQPETSAPPSDFSLSRDFELALADLGYTLRGYDDRGISPPTELNQARSILLQFRTHLRDSSPDKGKGGARRKRTAANGGDRVNLGGLFKGQEDTGPRRYGTYSSEAKKPSAIHLEDKRRTYNFESTPISSTFYSYEEENKKIVGQQRRPDSRNVATVLKSFDFLGPSSTTSRNTPINLSRDTVVDDTADSPIYGGSRPKDGAYQNGNHNFKSGYANTPVTSGRKTPLIIDSGIDSGSLEEEDDQNDGTYDYHRNYGLALTSGDPTLDRVIHIHLVILAQGLQKLSSNLDKPLTRAHLIKLVSIHCLCLEILYEVVVHGVPQDEKVIVAIINKYSNLNGWGNVNQIVDFWKRMNPAPFLVAHLNRFQNNLERHYLSFLLEKHSQQVISLVFPKEISQIQQVVPGALKSAVDSDDDNDGVRHYVTLLQFILYLKLHGIQDFKVHLEGIARELEFRDLFATGNQNGIIKFLLSLRNDLPPGDSFDIICRLLCNNEEINRFTVSYLNRVHSNFRVRGKAVSQALACLESPEGIIRCGACRALQHLKASECIPQLVATFQRDPSFRVKEFARISLLNMGQAGIRAYDEILSRGSSTNQPRQYEDQSGYSSHVRGSGIYDINEISDDYDSKL